MSETSLPAVELFIPEDEVTPSDECAQIAFNLITTYGMEQEEIHNDLIFYTCVTDRVDANAIGPDGMEIALRLRTAPMYCLDGLQGLPDDDGRDFGVALLECGVKEADLDQEYAYDEDFSWDARVAIVLDTESNDMPYICDAKSGRELSYEEQMNLMFLLEYVQKNLQAELTRSFAENAAESSRTVPLEDKGMRMFEPKSDLFIYGNQCGECKHSYGHCTHKPHTLN